MSSPANSTDKHLREWQSRMNWASDAERNIFLLACICCILLPPLGISSIGIMLSALLLASHLLLLLYCATNVQRKFAIASNLLVMISLANFLLANYSGLQHADILIYLFCLLAIISLPFASIGYRRCQTRAREHLAFQTKDDFRWMLTNAPLLARWRFLELLRGIEVLP